MIENQETLHELWNSTGRLGCLAEELGAALTVLSMTIPKLLPELVRMQELLRALAVESKETPSP